jgi:hypothetical protein
MPLVAKEAYRETLQALKGKIDLITKDLGLS